MKLSALVIILCNTCGRQRKSAFYRTSLKAGRKRTYWTGFEDKIKNQKCVHLATLVDTTRILKIKMTFKIH